MKIVLEEMLPHIRTYHVISAPVSRARSDMSTGAQMQAIIFQGKVTETSNRPPVHMGARAVQPMIRTIHLQVADLITFSPSFHAKPRGICRSCVAFLHIYISILIPVV